VQQGSACVSAGQQGDVAQLVEHLLCKQGVGGSSPLVSTTKPLLPRVLAVVSGGVTGRGSFATANRRISTSFGIRSRRSRRRAEYSLLEVSWMMGGRHGNRTAMTEFGSSATHWPGAKTPPSCLIGDTVERGGHDRPPADLRPVRRPRSDRRFVLAIGIESLILGRAASTALPRTSPTVTSKVPNAQRHQDNNHDAGESGQD
jgi:hypothetical protein